MHAHQHPTTNTLLTAPAGTPDVVSLPVSAVLLPTPGFGATPAVVSYWRPDADELARLNAGKSVAVIVLGTTQPPMRVCVDTEEPFGFV